jgi:hypothetical protein
MLFRILPLLLCLLIITGCDKIKALTGANEANPKELDAQAMGYACRVSKKPPESCMKENETYSPTHILRGWKSADKDIKDHVIIDSGPSSESVSASAVHPLPPSEGKSAEGKSAESKSPEGKNTENH